MQISSIKPLGLILMSKDLEEFLIEEIKKSGYPLEFEITSILEENKWEVTNNEYYIDKATNKEREIDIVASESFFKEYEAYLPLFAQIDIVIECKKSNTHAWVFFSRPNEWIPMYSGHYIDSLQVITDKRESLYRETIGDDVYLYGVPKKVASTYAEYKLQKYNKGQKGSQKEEIFTAVNQLINCIFYRKEQQIEKTAPKSFSGVLESVSIAFYFPVIVLDGELYECSIDGGEPNLQETNRVLLRYRHPEGIIFIDVVKKEYFADFLKQIYDEKQRIFFWLNEKYFQIIENAQTKKRKDYVA